MKKLFIGISILFLFYSTGCSNENVATDVDQTQDDTNVETPENETDVNNSVNEEQSEKEDEFPVQVVFNETEVIGDQTVISNPENLMILVNKQFSLPSDYIPDDLVRPDVAFSFGDLDIEKSYMRKEAAQALEELFAEAKKAGLNLYAVSGYRSFSRQEQIFQNEVNEKGEEYALEAVAYPGQSEHQTGLAMDISSEAVGYLLTEQFEQTDEGIWLKENAHRFGFILRYPKGKEEITGYQFEPWHFRYVGKEIAELIYENDWTLEEFFDHANEY